MLNVVCTHCTTIHRCCGCISFRVTSFFFLCCSYSRRCVFWRIHPAVCTARLPRRRTDECVSGPSRQFAPGSVTPQQSGKGHGPSCHLFVLPLITILRFNTPVGNFSPSVKDATLLPEQVARTAAVVSTRPRPQHCVSVSVTGANPLCFTRHPGSLCSKRSTFVWWFHHAGRGSGTAAGILQRLWGSGGSPEQNKEISSGSSWNGLNSRSFALSVEVASYPCLIPRVPCKSASAGTCTWTEKMETTLLLQSTRAATTECLCRESFHHYDFGPSISTNSVDAVDRTYSKEWGRLMQEPKTRLLV